MEEAKKKHANRIITAQERNELARAYNCVRVLVEEMLFITPQSIQSVYDISLSRASKPQLILIPHISKVILEDYKKTI